MRVTGADNFGNPEDKDSEQCWNGHDSAPYKAAIVEDGLDNQMHNPEVSLTADNSNVQSRFGLPHEIKEQLFKLQSISNQLRLAHGGQDIEWWDQQDKDGRHSSLLNDQEEEGSGSGDFDDDHYSSPYGRGSSYGYEGSGAGGSFITDDEDYADHPYEEGSGDDHVDTDTPWRPWSPEEMDDINRNTIDDTVDNNSREDEDVFDKPSESGSNPSVRMKHKNSWELTKTVVKFLLPTTVCWLTSILTDSPLTLW